MILSSPVNNQSSDEALCLAARGGSPLAEELLLLRHRRTVLSCSRSYFLAGGESEDLVQEGMIGLLKALRSYEPGRGSSFRTYAVRCIHHALITAVVTANRGKQHPLNNSLPLETSLSDGVTPLCLAEALPSPNPEELIIAQEELAERLATLKSIVSSFEGRILDHYLKGLSHAEIAQAVGCSCKSVDNAVQRMRRKLAQRGTKAPS